MKPLPIPAAPPRRLDSIDVLRGLSLLWLPSSTFSILGLSVFAMFYGLDWIATVPPTVRIAAGRRAGADRRVGDRCRSSRATRRPRSGSR